MTLWFNDINSKHWKLIRGYGLWHVCQFEYKGAGTLQTVDDAVKVYNFQTKEFAEACLAQMYEFDHILQDFIWRDTVTNLSIGKIPTSTYSIARDPPSDWRCQLFGTQEGLTLHPRKDQVPNWFWRKMQYLAFGNRWIKEK